MILQLQPRAAAPPMRMPRRVSLRRHLGACAPGDVIDPSTGLLCSSSNSGNPLLLDNLPLDGGGVNLVPPQAPTSGSTILAAGVPDGSTLTYAAQWQLGYNQTPAQAIAAVQKALQGTGISISGSAASPSLASEAVATITFSSVTVQITLTVKVNTGQGGFATPDDVASIINHAVYQVTGQMPGAYNIALGGTPLQPASTSGSSGSSSASSGIDWTPFIWAGMAGVLGIFAIKAFL